MQRSTEAWPRFVAAGAGRMGRSIALAFAWAGFRISLVDLKVRTPSERQGLAADIDAELRAHLGALVDLGALEASQLPDVLARIRTVFADEAPTALGAAELVFEGVPETLDAKRETFEVLSRHCSAEAILTSTTSSILVTELAPLVTRPERFLNIHWLNPAYLIPVVELSVHPGTDPDVLARARSLMESIGKMPVVCGATPGYIVPRLQALIMNEAARMVEEGAATAEDIDRATRFGMGLRFAAIGVVEFIDFGGADILHHASREMSASVSAERYQAPAVIGRMMAQGDLGLKTGRGFYDYRTRDVAAYRRDVLSRTLSMLRHAGGFRPASRDTIS
jgi:3-hydroxybutyryl-CoA dehydrogenase